MTKLEKILVNAMDKEVADNFFTLEDRENNLYSHEMFADEVPRLSETALLLISRSKDPKQEFEDVIDDLVLEASLYEDHWSIEEFDFGDEKDYVQLHEEEAESWMEEHVQVRVPIDSFLDQMVSVNLILATKGEADRDFGEYQAMNFYSGYSHQIGQDNALMWLIANMEKPIRLSLLWRNPQILKKTERNMRTNRIRSSHLSSRNWNRIPIVWGLDFLP